MIKQKVIGVYKYTSPCGKIYVGSSKNIYHRFIKYKNSNCLTQRKLLESIQLYGFISANFEIIEQFEIFDKNILSSRERYWQEYYNVLHPNGLNLYLVKTIGIDQVFSEESLIVKQLFRSKHPDKYSVSSKQGHVTQKTKNLQLYKESYDKRVLSRRQQVIINSIEYDSGSDASRKLGISTKIINRRLLSIEYPEYIRK